MVGEHGPEIVTGPVNVTSRRETAAMASAAMNMSAYRPIAATTQVSAAPSTVSIHAPISIVAQPGQSAQDIAQEVARQLGQRHHLRGVCGEQYHPDKNRLFPRWARPAH
nr:hypothetical protein [Candidatus Symbiopectobacterium sp. 'North America']